VLIIGRVTAGMWDDPVPDSALIEVSEMNEFRIEIADDEINYFVNDSLLHLESIALMPDSVRLFLSGNSETANHMIGNIRLEES